MIALLFNSFSGVGGVAVAAILFKLYWPVFLFYGGIFFAHKTILKLAEQQDAERTGKESIRIKLLIWSIFFFVSLSSFGGLVWLDDKYDYTEKAIEIIAESDEAAESILEKIKEYKDNLTK